MKVTLGGQRVGSGNRMQVELKHYERSTHDLGYLHRTTMSPGTLVPFLTEVALPGDTFDIELNADVKTLPTVGPLFGSYKLQYDVYEAPIRLYHGWLHNNKIGIGMNMASVLLPQIRLTATPYEGGPATLEELDIDNFSINPSCILSYLGIRGVGWVTGGGDPVPVTRDFNALPFLAYWDIYKNYYANKQEEIGAVIHKTPQVIDNGGLTGAVIADPAGGLGTAYPVQGGGSGNFELRATTQIRFNYSAGNITPYSLLIVTDTGLEIPITDALIGAEDTGAIYQGMWNFAKYGFQITPYYRILRPDELIQEPPTVQTFPLSNIDVMRARILENASAPSALIVNQQTIGVNDIPPYSWVCNPTFDGPDVAYNPMLSSQEGLGIKTYQSDLFNNWLQTTWIDGPNGVSAVTAIDTSGGSFTIDTLNLSKKVYDMLNRIAVSGGTYDDWLDVTYDHDRLVRPESPIYHGGLSKEIVFQEVVSNSQSQGDEGTQPLGTLAGKGILAQKHKGGKMIIRVNEPSYLIGIVSITPRIDYSQGNKWDTHLATMDDFHKPALDEIGFQELITEQMAWWSTTYEGPAVGPWTTRSAGKQPAWINYMTNTNRVLGNFAIKSNSMFMTLNRRYEPQIGDDIEGIQDLTTYIDPTKFNHIFAQTSIDAQNFWVQTAVDITARRKMSGRIMPNL